MNLFIFVGVVLEKPILTKKKGYFGSFQMASIQEGQEEATYINCIAVGSICYQLYNEIKTGTVLICRGRLLYNKQKNSNYVEITYFMNLSPKEPTVQMNIKEFLDIYKPDKIIEQIRQYRMCRKKENSSNIVSADDIPEDLTDDTEMENEEESEDESTD